MTGSSSASDLITKAWHLRAEAFDLPPDSIKQRQVLLTQSYDALSQAVDILRQQGKTKRLVNALRKLGHLAQDIGRVEQVLELYQEAVAVSRELADDILLAHNIRHLGDYHFNVGNFNAAERYYNEALNTYQGTEDSLKLDYANALRPMALLKEKIGKAEDAIELWQQARDLYDAVGVVEGVQECEQHLIELSR